MTKILSRSVLGAVSLIATLSSTMLAQQANAPYQHVLLISIDGMHALDLANCSKGAACPNLAQLMKSGVTYYQASSTKPSDSFPGLTALVTGAGPRTAGVFYDVSYDRYLAPPAQTTPFGIPGGANLCPGTHGTQVGYDESLDYDLTRLDGGAQAAPDNNSWEALFGGGNAGQASRAGINPAYLPRDPNT